MDKDQATAKRIVIDGKENKINYRHQLKQLELEGQNE